MSDGVHRPPSSLEKTAEIETKLVRHNGIASITFGEERLIETMHGRKEERLVTTLQSNETVSRQRSVLAVANSRSTKALAGRLLTEAFSVSPRWLVEYRSKHLNRETEITVNTQRECYPTTVNHSSACLFCERRLVFMHAYSRMEISATLAPLWRAHPFDGCAECDFRQF